MEQETQVAEQLREGLRAERRIYEALEQIAEKQDSVLEDGATEELLRLARAKEAELQRIEHAEALIAPLKEQWPHLREAIDPALRQEVETELDGIQNVLRRLIDLENRGQRGMEDRRRDTAEKIQQVEGGRRVHQAYRPATSAPAPRYLDRSE